MSIYVLLASLLGCGDPDGALRITLEGTLYEPDGTQTEFKGRGRDSSNDPDDVFASVDVTGGKTESGSKWEFNFWPPPGQLSNVGAPNYYSNGDLRAIEPGAWDGTDWTVPDVDTMQLDSGKLALEFIVDKREDMEPLHHTVGYELEVASAGGGGFDGTLVARFSNGVLFDGEIIAKGTELPDEGDDGTYTTDPGGGGACETFSDQTSYYGDMQLDSLCWAAGLYGACDDADAKEASCASLEGMEDCCYTGSGSCPYC